jgi:hypothetical protein
VFGTLAPRSCFSDKISALTTRIQSGPMIRKSSRPADLQAIGNIKGSSALGPMMKTYGSDLDERALPLLWTVLAITGVVACFWFSLFYLSRPTSFPNPGLAAYTPPPGTRLLPLPRVSDAPELADVPIEPTSPLTAMAQAQTSQKQAKDPPSAHKRPRTVPRETEQRTLGYAPQWNGYGSWEGNRSPSGGPRLSGGPKSWF